jgi:hypothetical protein
VIHSQEAVMSILSRIRLILAFAIATALPALLVAAPFLLDGQWRSAFMMMELGLSITIPPVLLVVLPLFFWLSSTGRLNIVWSVVAGAAGGAAFGLYGVINWIWRFGGNKTLGEIWSGSLAYADPELFLLVGAVCGFIGWLIAFGPRIAVRVSCASAT